MPPILAVGHVVLTVMAEERSSAAMVFSVVAAALGILGGLAWLAKRPLTGGWATAVVVVCLGVAYSDFTLATRTRRSPQIDGLAIRDMTGPAATLIGEKAVQDFPATFHYARLPVDRNGSELAERIRAGQSGWYVIHWEEWQAWPPGLGDRCTRVTKLPGQYGTILAWVEAEIETVAKTNDRKKLE